MKTSLGLSAAVTMKNRFKMAALPLPIVLAAIFLAAPQAKADGLTFCGLNGGTNSVTITAQAPCVLTTGATVSGTATAVVTPTSDTITLTNLVISDPTKQAISGTYLIASNTYNFVGGGQGTLYVEYSGRSSSATWPPAKASGSIGFDAFASTFNNNDAAAGPTTIPTIVNGKKVREFPIAKKENTKQGKYSAGKGDLDLYVTYALYPGETLTLDAKAIAATPESPAWIYLLLGVIAICGATLLRSRSIFGRGVTA